MGIRAIVSLPVPPLINKPININKASGHIYKVKRYHWGAFFQEYLANVPVGGTFATILVGRRKSQSATLGSLLKKSMASLPP